MILIQPWGCWGPTLQHLKALQTHLTDGGLLWRVQKDLGTVTVLDPHFGVYPVYPWYVAPGGFNVSERSLDVADKHPRLSEAGMEPKICLQYFTIVYTTREYHWLQSSHYRSETKLPHNRLGWPWLGVACRGSEHLWLKPGDSGCC